MGPVVDFQRFRIPRLMGPAQTCKWLKLSVNARRVFLDSRGNHDLAP